MKFKELYSKGLDRKVNPAVSASDLSEDTVMTEIVEYVFTEEIVINLYDILVNIRQNQGSHVGIWINGYFGTGKSHFLKYVSYCLNAHYSEMAFMRLEEAIEEIMRNSNGMTKLDDHGVSLSEIQALKKWYSTQADVQMVMFNIAATYTMPTPTRPRHSPPSSGTSSTRSVATIRSTSLWRSIWKKRWTMTASSASSRII